MFGEPDKNFSSDSAIALVSAEKIFYRWKTMRLFVLSKEQTFLFFQITVSNDISKYVKVKYEQSIRGGEGWGAERETRTIVLFLASFQRGSTLYSFAVPLTTQLLCQISFSCKKLLFTILFSSLPSLTCLRFSDTPFFTSIFLLSFYWLNNY